MNYILEINAFYNWLELNPISTSAIALWQALMSVANKTFWQEELSIPLSILEMKTGLKRGTVVSARKVLADAGRLIVLEQTGQKACVYKLIPFANYEKPCEIVAIKSPVYKQNYTKQNYTKSVPKKSSYDIEELEKFWNDVPKL